MKISLPPSAFSNAMSDINSDFDFRFWQISPEWKIFCLGYNFALEEIADVTKIKKREVNKQV